MSAERGILETRYLESWHLLLLVFGAFSCTSIVLSYELGTLGIATSEHAFSPIEFMVPASCSARSWCDLELSLYLARYAARCNLVNLRCSWCDLTRLIIRTFRHQERNWPRSCTSPWNNSCVLRYSAAAAATTTVHTTNGIRCAFIELAS